jgi:hypothetical protein
MALSGDEDHIETGRRFTPGRITGAACERLCLGFGSTSQLCWYRVRLVPYAAHSSWQVAKVTGSRWETTRYRGRTQW